jgi:hypothetical protein
LPIWEVSRDNTGEARGRIELPIKVLQTFALPLGYRALDTRCVTQSRRES